MNAIFTVGYEGTSIDQFIATLEAVGVTLLADVRELPLSRKKGFSKNQLREALATSGIKYRHFKSLGDPKAGRDAARAGRTAEFHRIYKSHFISEDSQAAYLELLDLAKTEVTCMLCFERCAADCHRSFIADAAVYDGFEVINISTQDPQKYIGNVKKIPRYNPRQSLTAAE